MSSQDQLALRMCREILSLADLQVICRHRRWNLPRSGKDNLAAYVAPRLVESAGVAEAMRTLDDRGLLLLHAIAQATEPPTLSFLRPLLQDEIRGHSRWVDARILFRTLTERLFNRGLVVAGESTRAPAGRGSRLDRLEFHWPEAHRPHLAPFPIPAQPMETQSRSGSTVSFCRKALALASRGGRIDRDSSAHVLIDRIAALFSVKGGKLCFAGAPALRLKPFLSRVQAEWMKVKIAGRNAEERTHILGWIVYMLAHLPPGSGATVAALAQGLELVRCDAKIDLEELANFCQAGHEAGLLSRGGAQRQP